MCEVWTAEQWQANSQPAKSDSRFTLVDTCYNQSGVEVHTYRSLGGTWWGVLPGHGNDAAFTEQADALDFLAHYGYNLAEKPQTIAEVIAEFGAPDLEELAFHVAPSTFGDLVQDFA
jgi:hypothetical protein